MNATMEAQQALAILRALGTMPAGTRIDLDRCANGQWHLTALTPLEPGYPFASRAIEYWGDSLNECLANFTQGLAR